MILSPEEVRFYSADITNSDLSPAVKERALQILNTPNLEASSLDEIADLIQKEIDADITSMEGLGEQIAADPEYQAAVAQAEEEIQEIQADLQESMNFLETEGGKLDALAAELDQAIAEVSLEDVKNRLAQNKA